MSTYQYGFTPGTGSQRKVIKETLLSWLLVDPSSTAANKTAIRLTGKQDLLIIPRTMVKPVTTPLAFWRIFTICPFANYSAAYPRLLPAPLHRHRSGQPVVAEQLCHRFTGFDTEERH